MGFLSKGVGYWLVAVVMARYSFISNLCREDVRNLILGYPSLTNKIFETLLGEIHRVNPEILGYPRIPGSPLTTSLGKMHV